MDAGDAIHSERLDLVLLTPDLMEALVAGRRGEAAARMGTRIPEDWPDAHDESFFRFRLAQVARVPADEPWLVRAVVLPEPVRTLIGHAGFHGAPGINGPGKAAALELGYTVFPPFRGHGYATEAASALMRWARAHHGIRHFIASVAPENAPSLAIVSKLGFVQTGEQWDDEDGLELVFERTLE